MEGSTLLQDLRIGNFASSHRTSFSSSTSDSDRLRRKGVDPPAAYSFVGMHCIFDQCRASGDFFMVICSSSDVLE